MKVTLLYFDDCPSWLESDRNVRVLAEDHPEIVTERRRVETVEDAEATGFRGSPSIMVDGVDLSARADAPVGMSCRVHQTADGFAGPPALDQLRDVTFGR